MSSPRIWLPANPTEVIVKMDDKGKPAFEQEQFNFVLKSVEGLRFGLRDDQEEAGGTQ